MKPRAKRPQAHSQSRRNCFRLVIAIFLLALSAASLIAESGEKKSELKTYQFAANVPIFTDVTAAVGMSTTGYPFGNPIWGDYDGDGDLDLFVDNHYIDGPYFYKNNGDGTFTDIFDNLGLRAHGDRHGSGWCDFDK